LSTRLRSGSIGSVEKLPLSRRDRIWIGVFVLLGLALRLVLGHGELWLDEIWSVDFARGLEGPLSAFTLRHDNNHPLNTLMLRLLGPQEQALALRALPILAGSVAVLLGALWTARVFSPRAGVLAAALVASSTLLAYYTSEARGYALALCMVYAAALVLETKVCGRTLWFSLFCLIGLLSHFSFVFALAALGARELWLRRSPWVLLVPLAFSAGWYLYFISGMAVGGGDAWSLGSLGEDAAVQLLGWSGLPGLVVLAGLLLLLGWSLRHRQGELAMYGTLLALPFLLTFLILNPSFVALRYFLVPLSLLPLLAGGALATLGQAGRAGLVVTALICVGNLKQSLTWAQAGRGEYRAAIAWMLEQSREAVPTVSSDIAFDTRKTLAYHAQYVAGRGLRWVEPAQIGPEGVEWIVIASSQLPPENFTDRGSNYRRSREFAGAGPSSYRWVLYQRVR
jgi:hypothetical protein